MCNIIPVLKNGSMSIVSLHLVLYHELLSLMHICSSKGKNAFVHWTVWWPINVEFCNTADVNDCMLTSKKPLLVPKATCACGWPLVVEFLNTNARMK